MSTVTAFILSDTGQLLIVLTACVLMIAGTAAQELARKRRPDRLDAEARERYPEESEQLRAALESREHAGRPS